MSTSPHMVGGWAVERDAAGRWFAVRVIGRTDYRCGPVRQRHLLSVRTGAGKAEAEHALELAIRSGELPVR